VPDGLGLAEVRGAVRALAARHEALRSRLVSGQDGTLRQEVAPEVDPPVVAESTLLVPPEEAAMRCSVRMAGSQPVAVVLAVSHVFCDAWGRQLLNHDLRRLLAGDPLSPPSAQASAYARGPEHPRVVANTEFWQSRLAGVPRSCTYAAVARDEYEKADVARVPLPDELIRLLAAGGRALRVTPTALWAAAVSVLAGRASGQHRQVFRTTYANRCTRADQSVVTQLAQAVFVPVEGVATETLRERAVGIAASLVGSYDRGEHDVNGLLSWLNQAQRRHGVEFCPAFELNFVPRVHVEGTTPRPAAAEVDVRVDPPSAKADLVVTVANNPAPAVEVTARRPVRDQRPAARLAADCLTVVRLLCTEPDRRVADVPVAPFGAVETLVFGHRSGIGIDLDQTRRLIESVDGVESCTVALTPDGRLRATVRSDRPPSALRSALYDRQPWLTATAVPDDLHTS